MTDAQSFPLSGVSRAARSSRTSAARCAFMLLVVSWCIGCSAKRVHPGPSNDRQLITEDEIARSGAATALEAIQKLRGNFLSNRGRTSFYDTSAVFPTVYVDEQNFGEITVLRTIPARAIASIRLYRAWEASTRYGNGNTGGVIAITTKRGDNFPLVPVDSTEKREGPDRTLRQSF